MTDELREQIALSCMIWRLDDDNGDWPMSKAQACLDSIADPHSGDCTKQPWTCLRCEAEAAYRQADAVLALPALQGVENLREAAAPLISEIAEYPASMGEDDDELVEVKLGDLKALRRAALAQGGEQP